MTSMVSKQNTPKPLCNTSVWIGADWTLMRFLTVGTDELSARLGQNDAFLSNFLKANFGSLLGLTVVARAIPLRRKS